MIHLGILKIRVILLAPIVLMFLATTLVSQTTNALTAIPEPDPKPGSYGLEATKTQPPPKRGATITTPSNGASFTSSPTTVSGICPSDLLVQVYNNGVMVGAVVCTGGSFRLEVSLFVGTNELSALVFDETYQSGPKSNIVKITYTDAQFATFGDLITLTTAYGRRSASPGDSLRWPLQLSGGTGPYAFSIDWGDGSKPELKSQTLAGVVTIAHAYEKAGIYQVNIQVTDTDGVSAFLQVIALANGEVDATAAASETESTNVKAEILWVPSVASLALLLPSYWLGRRSQMISLRNKMAKERDSQAKK